MKHILFVVTLFFTVLMSAQNTGSIRGIVLDQEMNNEPLLFAQVQLKNSATVTETNFHGNFEINNVAVGNYILIIRYLGYETLEVAVKVADNDISTVQEVMQAEKISLEDISNSLTALKVDATSEKIKKFHK